MPIPPSCRGRELNPNDFAAIGNLGLTFSLRGDWDRAIYASRRSMERDPVRSYIAYANLAGSYRNLGMYARTREAARQALALRMDDFTATTNLAWADLVEGRTAQAVELMEAVMSDETDPSALAAAGSLFLLAGEVARARDALELAHSGAPDAMGIEWTAPAVLLAFVLQRDGASDRAAELLAESERLTREAIDQGNRIPTLPYTMATIAALRGQREQALDQLELAAERSFNDPALLIRDPLLAPLRGDPRFGAVHDRIRERNQAQRKRVEEAGW